MIGNLWTIKVAQQPKLIDTIVPTSTIFIFKNIYLLNIVSSLDKTSLPSIVIIGHGIRRGTVN